jgi:hypothetical protein
MMCKTIKLAVLLTFIAAATEQAQLPPQYKT